MRKTRYIAPWRRKAVAGTVHKTAALAAATGTAEAVASATEAQRALEGKPAIYHCISRVVGRQFVLGDLEKENFVSVMRDYEAFCQVRVLTFCVMSNHFHLLVEVPERPAADPTDEELLEHLRIHYAGGKMREIRWQLEQFRKQGDARAAEALRQKFLCRMWDLSAFMQSLKQRFSRWYNSREGRDGFLWSERFKSVLVEDGHAARVMAGYIDLNPVRAGMVKKPEEYRWSGYGEATAGKKKAREGLQWVMLEKWRQTTSSERAAMKMGEWRTAEAVYRLLLAADEEKRKGDRSEDGAKRRGTRVGLPRLSEVQMLRCRVRYFTDGLVIGTRKFVAHAFALTRDQFGPRRRNGPRKLARAETELRTMRALRVRAYGG